MNMKELLKLQGVMAVMRFFAGGDKGLLSSGSYLGSSDTGHHSTGRGKRNKATAPNDGRWHLKHHRNRR